MSVLGFSSLNGVFKIQVLQGWPIPTPFVY